VYLEDLSDFYVIVIETPQTSSTFFLHGQSERGMLELFVNISSLATCCNAFPSLEEDEETIPCPSSMLKNNAFDAQAPSMQ
jgi:hypothetical protein